MSEVKVNKISPRSGTEVTLGDSGDTFTIPSGATINNQGTAVNFGATGSASWVTTVKTSTFTAVAGEGYFVNTTSGAINVTLPAGSAGDVVAIKDYAGTFDSNTCTLARNGSKIGGKTIDATLTIEGIAVTLTAPEVVFTKYPVPATAVKSPVLTVVFQDAAPVAPKPDAVPEFVIDTPAGIVNVSPLSPNVVVPHAVLGLILFTFTSLIIFTY